jgi:hypothetical protein
VEDSALPPFGEELFLLTLSWADEFPGEPIPALFTNRGENDLFLGIESFRWLGTGVLSTGPADCRGVAGAILSIASAREETGSIGLVGLAAADAVDIAVATVTSGASDSNPKPGFRILTPGPLSDITRSVPRLTGNEFSTNPSLEGSISPAASAALNRSRDSPGFDK